ncbi:MAG: hypothetical protein ACFB0G_06780 [Leptolyngbyaceae cyanobacterium]
MLANTDWAACIRTEIPLTHYPKYQWRLDLDAKGSPQFDYYPTVSRHLTTYQGTNPKICPYGDEVAPIARLEQTQSWQEPRDAYTLSALRFQLNPFKLHQTKSRPSTRHIGIPTPVRHLHKVSERHQIETDRVLKAPSLREFETALDKMQQTMQAFFIDELLPCMTANPLDVGRHRHELPPEFADDLEQYVRLQNSPYLFFDLLQSLERDVARYRRVTALAGAAVTTEEAMIQVMRSWRDLDGHRRKKPIVFPIGVPIGYIQSIRRKDQPFMTKEFGYHSHGALNHWLQEHIWRRFCYRYPDQHQLHPCGFLKKLGSVHFAFPDTIYELHVEEVANPANTHFWAVLQNYFPLLSPWP